MFCWIYLTSTFLQKMERIDTSRFANSCKSKRNGKQIPPSAKLDSVYGHIQLRTRNYLSCYFQIGKQIKVTLFNVKCYYTVRRRRILTDNYEPWSFLFVSA